jgi:hypothetical protein
VVERVEVSDVGGESDVDLSGCERLSMHRHGSRDVRVGGGRQGRARGRCRGLDDGLRLRGGMVKRGGRVRRWSTRWPATADNMSARAQCKNGNTHCWRNELSAPHGPPCPQLPQGMPINARGMGSPRARAGRYYKVRELRSSGDPVTKEATGEACVIDDAVVQCWLLRTLYECALVQFEMANMG